MCGQPSSTPTEPMPELPDVVVYLEAIERGDLPVTRAFATTSEQRLTRELILQLKLGEIRPSYFGEKFGADILQQFATQLTTLEEQGMLVVADDTVRLTPDGLLRVDSLLPEFYAREYQHARYT